MHGCLEKLYIGPKAEEMETEIRRVIARGRIMPDLFLLTFASNGRDQLDIIESRFLRNKKTRERLPAIVGFGIGREETEGLVAQIARDAFLATGGCDMRGYLLSIQPDGR